MKKGREKAAIVSIYFLKADNIATLFIFQRNATPSYVRSSYYLPLAVCIWLNDSL